VSTTSPSIQESCVTGANLYLRHVIVVNIDSRRLHEAAYFWGIIRRPGSQYVVISPDASPFQGYRRLLRRTGFVEVPTPTKYLVFRREGVPGQP